MRQEDTALCDGWQAQLAGERRTANPHPEGTDLHQSWNEGWDEREKVRPQDRS